jgi:hypothetical protein
LGVLAFAACSTVASAEPQASMSARGSVTRIPVNGEGAFVNLYDPNTGAQGFAWPTRDQITNTAALDFSYVTPTSDPNIVTLFQGAGEIPNSAFTTTFTTARLIVTTPFPVLRCEVIVSTGVFECDEGAPIAFDLLWSQNGFIEVDEHLQRQEKIGPLTIRFNGQFKTRSALVSGSWNGSSALDMSGDLFDTQSTTVIREITIARQQGKRG